MGVFPDLDKPQARRSATSIVVHRCPAWRARAAATALAVQLGLCLLDVARRLAGTLPEPLSAAWLRESTLRSVAFALTALAFIAWLRRVYENLGSARAMDPRWTTWGWVAPGPNLVVPFLLVREVVRPLGPRARWLSAAWWTAWLGHLLAGLASGLAADALGALAAALAIALVLQVTRHPRAMAPLAF